MTERRLRYLYERYLNNICTEEEQRELWEVIDGGKYESELEILSDEFWDNHEVTHELNEEKANQIFANVLTEAGEVGTEQRRTLLFSDKKWLAIAATLALFVAAALLFNRNSGGQKATVALLQSKTTLQHQLIKLADGSTVVLNGSSSLKYPQAFNGDRREVTLTGEGYFDIKHDAGHPFIVHTGKLITTVLGTAFNIKAYDEEKNIIVTVTRGKVSVSDKDKVLGIITPNQQLSFDKVKDNVVQMAVNSIQTVEWQSKDLFFEDTNMQEAASQLEQRFNVKITFTNEAVKKCRFTGTFLHGEKLKDILQVICDFNNATYKTTNDGQIVINGPGCSS